MLVSKTTIPAVWVLIESIALNFKMASLSQTTKKFSQSTSLLHRFLRPGSTWVSSKSWSRTFSDDPFIYGFTLPSSLSKASILQGFTERQSLHRHCRCFFWQDLTPLARGIRRKSKSHSDVEGFPHPCWFLIRVRDCWSLKAVLRIVWSSVRVNVCMYGGRSVEVRATSAERCLDAAFRCYWLAASRKEDRQPLRFGVRVAKWCLLRPLD